MTTEMAIVGLQGGIGIGILGFFAFIVLVILARSARIVSQYEKGLVLRLGKYHATASSGLNFLLRRSSTKCTRWSSASRSSTSSRRR